jgi:hypothetical protein
MNSLTPWETVPGINYTIFGKGENEANNEYLKAKYQRRKAYGTKAYKHIFIVLENTAIYNKNEYIFVMQKDNEAGFKNAIVRYCI